MSNHSSPAKIAINKQLEIQKPMPMTDDQALLDWLHEHSWFLEHHRMPVVAARYVFKCGFLAGMESTHRRYKSGIASMYTEPATDDEKAQ